MGVLRPMDTMTQNAENRSLNDKFMLRLPDGMRDRIKAAAEAANRSMNAEIVATLEEKYPAPPLVWNEIMEDFLQALNSNLPSERPRLMREANKKMDEAGYPYAVYSLEDEKGQTVYAFVPKPVSDPSHRPD